MYIFLTALILNTSYLREDNNNIKVKKSIYSFTYFIKIMGLIRFLKPDLKRIVILLIILSPLILVYLPIPSQFDMWYSYIYPFVEAVALPVALPFILTSIILFGGIGMGGYGLFPFSSISGPVTYSIGILFWYLISCAIVTLYDLLFKSFERKQ